jgi:hypothetical protein
MRPEPHGWSARPIASALCCPATLPKRTVRNRYNKKSAPAAIGLSHRVLMVGAVAPSGPL